MWLLYSTMAVFAGAILDFLFGDINVWWHPICLIGKLISATEKMIRRNIADVKSDEEKIIRMERQGGVVFSIIVMAISSLVPCIALLFTYKINVVVGFILESLLCWFMLAARCLYKESMKVGIALENEGLEAGRTAVSMIVGRDTADLSEEGVIKATVETVAENTSDGVIAPLFYMLIGGASLGFLYKSINTMDSMVGYKNDKYINFGRFAAKTDDVVNFIPSRLGGLFMILAAALGGYNAKNAARIFGRDRKKHASPNSANTESVMAGALEVQLAGDAVYFGKLYEKPFIGDALRPVEVADIKRAGNLMFITSFLFAAVGFALKGLVLLCMNMAGIFTVI